MRVYTFHLDMSCDEVENAHLILFVNGLEFFFLPFKREFRTQKKENVC